MKINFIKAEEVISSFIVKFDLYKTNIYHQELSQFPNLRACIDVNVMISVDNIQIITDHLLHQKKEHEINISRLASWQTSN